MDTNIRPLVVIILGTILSIYHRISDELRWIQIALNEQYTAFDVYNMEVSMEGLKHGDVTIHYFNGTISPISGLPFSLKTVCKLAILSTPWCLFVSDAYLWSEDGDPLERLIRVRQDMRNKNEKG